MIAEEHDLPTEESAQVKQARLWLHLDKVAHKIEESARGFTEWVASFKSQTESPSVKAPIVNSKQCSDESITAHESAHVQSMRVTLPKEARELVIAVAMAISVITSLWLWSKLHDAEKDIQTQIWLKDDALTKFQQGPYADLKAHVLALEITCKK
jgi:hypothetical protein